MIYSFSILKTPTSIEQITASVIIVCGLTYIAISRDISYRAVTDE
jgi:hypothetical protein